MKPINCLIVLVILLTCHFTKAQNDFGLWLKHDLSFALNKKVKFGIDFQARFDRNISRNKELFTTPTVQWEVHKYINIGAEYRFTYFPSTVVKNGDPLSHRFTANFEFQNIQKLFNKKSDFGLSLRIAGTSEHQAFERASNYIRTRIKMDYNIPKTKIKPELSAELFYHFNDRISYSFTEVTTSSRFNKLRIKLGVEYPILLKHKVSIYGQYQREFLTNNNDLVLCVSYSYNINKKSKKSKKSKMD